MIRKKRNFTLWLHILVWAIWISLPYIIYLVNPYPTHAKSTKDSNFFLLNAITYLFWIAVFYLNTEVLIPRLIYRKKFWLFALVQFVLFLTVMFIHKFIFLLLFRDIPFIFLKSTFYNLMPFLLIILFSIVYRTIKDRVEADALESERQKEHLKTELSFLRSQISPHFLFNVMNNLVAMTRLKSAELEPTIIKLSSLMQYMLYNTDEEKVILKNEIDYLKSYIDLQKQRFGKNLQLNVSMDAAEDWHTIEPMLLIPFVENAFKHGTGAIQDPVINIQLTSQNNHLHFVVSNRYNPADEAKDKSSGIGLLNVERRLELLYGKRHQLTITRNADIFTVTLSINFQHDFMHRGG